MSLIRKALWPAAVALSLMVFMALAGTSARTVSAAHGDICGVFSGAEIVSDGETNLIIEEGQIAVWAVIHGEQADDGEDDGVGGEDHSYSVEVDSAGGNAIIVRVLGDGDSPPVTFDDLEEVGPTGEVNDVEPADPDDFDGGLNNALEEAGFDEELSNDECDEADCDTGDADDPETDEDESVDECDNEVVLVIIDCEEEGGGTFDVSFIDESEDDDSMSIEIECRGPSDDATLTCHPCTIEIIPAPGNVAHSFIRLELVDEHGEAAFPGEEVLFTVDRCGIEESEVDTEDEFEEAEELFEDFGPNVPSVAAAIENSDFATSDPDGNESEDNTVSFSVDDDGDDERTVAAAIVHCDIGHTQESVPTPGVITVTAIVEQDGADDIYSVKITVVGPPATITVNASPAELRCGEKAQIVVVVKDSIGQNVSDHTQVEAVTNAGGVLGGTGAVIGQAGPVVPISSTVAETFGGTTTFFLLTSEQHSGPYEVVVTTGGANVTAAGGLSGLFSSAPISVQTTVRCSIPVVAAPVAPAAVPTVTAPRTGDLGTGTIRPPSTGDAGLADASGANWGLLAVAGVVAFGLAGVATVKVSRR